MVLGFKTKFQPLILDGSKIHTIREDKKHRWKTGMSIHFATGIRTANYNCFKQGYCVSTQTIEIKWLNDNMPVSIFIDGRLIGDDEIDVLARNDGFFNDIAFLNWESWYKKDFKGKIIHWTDKKY